MQVLYCDACGVKLPEQDRPGHVGVALCEKCSASRSAAPTTPPPLPALQEKSAPAGTMGFYFCEKCGKRVTAADLARGHGRDKQLKGVHCSACSDGTMTVSFDAISQAEIWKEEQARRQANQRPHSTPGVAGKDCNAPRRGRARTSTPPGRKASAAVKVAVFGMLLLCGGGVFLAIGSGSRVPSPVVSNRPPGATPRQAESLSAPVPAARPATLAVSPAQTAPVTKREPAVPEAHVPPLLAPPVADAEPVAQVPEPAQTAPVMEPEPAVPEAQVSRPLAAPEADAEPDRNVMRAEKDAKPWTPAELATAAWYDASDAGTIVQSGGAVSQWKDKSGSGRHLSQDTSGARPKTGTRTMGGLHAIEFDGTNDVLLGSPNRASAITLFGVILVDAGRGTDGNRSWLSAAAGKANPDYWMTAPANSDALGAMMLDSSRSWEGQSVSATRGAAHLQAAYSWIAGGADGGVRVDGGASRGSISAKPHALNQASTGLVIGRQKDTPGRFHDGLVGEVIIINRRLTEADADFLKIEGYLAHKWGLAANLPADHPYKNAAPTR